MKTPETRGRLRLLNEAERTSILAALEAENVLGIAWLEKIRRFTSLYGRNLASEARKRFGTKMQCQLLWMASFLLKGAKIHPERGSAPIDAATLNAGLFTLDAAPDSSLEIEAADAVAELAAWLRTSRSRPPVAQALGTPFSVVPSLWREEAKFSKPVVIISPNPYSLGSLSVLELCLRFEIPVKAILLRRFTVARFTQEWHRDGPRLLKKIWRKLLLKADENTEQVKVSLKSICKSLDPPFPDIRKRASMSGIPVIAVAEFNDAVSKMNLGGTDIALFTGGGLIKNSLLECFNTGIINVHMGILPQYKGMDVVQAPILDGAFESVGLTAHLMEPALDAGPIVTSIQVSSDHYGTLGSLRNELSAISPLMAIDAALGLASSRLKPLPQPHGGRQYYFVHKHLLSVLEKTMKERQDYTIRENSIHKQTNRFFVGLKSSRGNEGSSFAKLV